MFILSIITVDGRCKEKYKEDNKVGFLEKKK
jgi:hypothetical protein